MRIKGTLYFLQVNQKFIPEHTAMLLLKFSKARPSLPMEEWIRLMLPYLNRAQVQADEYAVSSPSKLQSSMTVWHAVHFLETNSPWVGPHWTWFTASLLSPKKALQPGDKWAASSFLGKPWTVTYFRVSLRHGRKRKQFTQISRYKNTLSRVELGLWGSRRQ